MPTGAGANKVLTTDASGVASWQTAAGGTNYWTLSGTYLFPTSTSYNVGIGTTAPGSKLDVDGNIAQSVTHGNNMKLWLSAARNGGGTGEVGLYSWISEPGVTWTGGGIARNMYNTTSFPRINTGLSGQMMRFAEGNNIEFTIETAAGARTTPFIISPGSVSATAFFYSSDESLKKNIQKIETPLAKIMKLNGISFDWKESGKKSIGLIAQDVEKVFPEIVNTDEETGLKSIEYGKLVAPLIEAVKEQQRMIDEQKELIDKQEEEIKKLKALFE